MKAKIKNNFNVILMYFILLQPILDLMTSVSINTLNINLTIGMIIKTLFLLFIMISTVYVYKKKNALWYYSLILLYALFFVASILIYENGSNLFGELQGLLRTFYFPVLLYSLFLIKDEINIKPEIFITVAAIYIFLILVPMILGIGFESYQITKEGTVGFFNSANEIGAILAVLTPIMFLLIKNQKKYLTLVILMICYIVVILNVGTKTPLLSFLFTIFFMIIWIFIRNIKKRKYKSLIASILVVLIMILSISVILPKTAFYKNIKVHLDYLHVNNIHEIFENPQLIDHFIFSERLKFLDNKYKIYDNSSIYEKIIGIGYYNDNKEIKMIEMDYFDIYYSHGPVGFILIFSIYIYVLIKILKLKKIISSEENLYEYLKLISICLVLILSLFTGHIITSPSVSFFVAFILLSRDDKKVFRK